MGGGGAEGGYVVVKSVAQPVVEAAKPTRAKGRAEGGIVRCAGDEGSPEVGEWSGGFTSRGLFCGEIGQDGSRTEIGLEGVETPEEGGRIVGLHLAVLEGEAMLMAVGVARWAVGITGRGSPNRRGIQIVGSEGG